MNKKNSLKTKKEHLLKVENFSVDFRMYDNGLNQTIQQAVHDISIDVYSGEIVAVVGSSGSGKSLLAHGVLGILPQNAIIGGNIIFKGETLTDKTIPKKRGLEIALVPQSISYLDPLMKTGRQIFGKEKSKAHRKIFEQFGFSPEDGEKYPFQLSGGMARRVLVMTSAISKAELIIADEPTPGLNPKLAHEILASFREMADQGKGVLLITHDIDLVCEVADRIAIFYGGTILETTSVENFAQGPEHLKHPYSKALWNALPQNNFEAVDIQQISNICKEQGFTFPDCTSEIK
ncbi:MAG: ATP-binding cassette domain-containing protein [Filifactoraceae bacterium]